MSESPSNGTSAEAERELDEIAERLYGLRPEDFTAAREEAVRLARAERRHPLARALSALRRPTQSAWLVNVMWRAHRQAMEEFLQLAGGLGRALAQGSVPEFQRLTSRRRELEEELLAGARTLAEQASVDVTPALQREVEETLAAALASPEVADQVRSGRLVRAASYAGFGPMEWAPPVQRPKPPPREPAERKAPPTPPPQRPKPTAADERAQRRERERREEAERRAAEAQASLEAAAAALAQSTGEAEEAERRHADLRGQLEQLRERLHQLEEEVTAAHQAARGAARRRDESSKAHEEARRHLERAEQRLNSGVPSRE